MKGGSPMENWWFFRDTKDAKIYEQRKIAEQLVPDRRHWLGGEPQAIPGFRFSRDLTELIYSDTEEQLHKPSADRPIKKGDIVYVSHLYVLASEIPAIQGVIRTCHSSGGDLRITSINYQDNNEHSDFALLNSVLNQISAHRKRRNTPKPNSEKRKPGRPSRNVHYWTLTQDGRNVVQDYVNGLISFNNARVKLTNKTPDRRSVGEKMFQRIIREYKSEKD